MASTGSPSLSASMSESVSSDDGAGAASGSPASVAGSPPSIAGGSSATSVATAWSAVSTEPSAAPVSPAPVSRSELPRTSSRGSSRTVAVSTSTAPSVSNGSRGSVTEFSLCCGGGPSRAGKRGRSAEDGDHALGEEQVEAGDQGHHDGDEDDDHGRVGDQLAASGPDDLAQLGDDLAQEPGQRALAADLRRPGLLCGGAGPGAPRGRRAPGGGTTSGTRRTGGRGGVVAALGGDRTAAAPGGRRHDLVLLLGRVGGDLGLGGLELRGVVDARSLRVELLVGQLCVGDGRGLVPGLAPVVAHCASLASWWWPSGGGRRSVLLVVRSCGRRDGTGGGAGVTGLEPAACGFGDRCSAN